MRGLMQDWPLLCQKLLDHAATAHPGREIVSRSVEGPIHRTTYSTLRSRALSCAKRFEAAGIRPGDRVATLAWNTWRHLEVWYGLYGLGAVCHTVNPRLFPEQIAWIVNHAEDRILVTDLTFLPLVEALMDRLKTIEHVIVLTDAGHMREVRLDAVPYEEWLAGADDDFEWRSVDENDAAGLCYTSGTTGHPKGVVYSHRSNVLHALAANQPDMLGLSSTDRVMPVVPMFHANCWSICHTAPMTGAALVMPGARMDGASIYEMLDIGRVTVTAGVPTVWMMLLQHLKETGKPLPHLRRVIVGGAAVPRSMIEAFSDTYGVTVCHAWGMTEMSPLGTACSLKPEYRELEGEQRIDILSKQGHAPFMVEMKITDDEGLPRPWDGRTYGRLKVRGPAIASAYFKEEGSRVLDDEGFFDTGDIAHIDPAGYMQITDRSKDVIKSGGEWISSIELENVAVGHPEVAEAAVIGVAHPKWDERPLLVLVRLSGSTVDGAAVLDYMRPRVAKWWMPDDVVFIDEMPHTATGKIQKIALRERFAGHALPAA